MAIPNSDAWERLLGELPGNTILVLGDLILDEFVTGDVKRISPEAPVPVVEFRERVFVAGGAANVAANLAAWGCLPLLAGVTGADEAGEHLRHTLQTTGVAVDAILCDPSRPTTLKSRILAHNQQIVRLDREISTAISNALENALLRWVENHLIRADACVLSDYGKGVVTPRFAAQVISLAKKAGVPVLVDPKSLGVEPLLGATLVKPNKHEAERMANAAIYDDEGLLVTGQHLAERLQGSAVLITCGSQGMVLFRYGVPALRVVTPARAVFDVTGAGDTVISMLAAAIAAGAGLEESMWLASQSAAIVVGKRGTATLSIAELRKALEQA